MPASMGFLVITSMIPKPPINGGLSVKKEKDSSILYTLGPQALYQLYFLLIVSLNGMKYVVEGEVVEGEIKNFIGVSVWFVKIALFKQSSIRVTSNEAILSLTSNIKSSSRTLT